MMLEIDETQDAKQTAARVSVQVNATVRQGAEAARQGGRATAEAVRQKTGVTADLTRQGTQAGVDARANA